MTGELLTQKRSVSIIWLFKFIFSLLSFFLLHRETLISQSFKKIGDSVTVHSPCEPIIRGRKNGLYLGLFTKLPWNVRSSLIIRESSVIATTFCRCCCCLFNDGHVRQLLSDDVAVRRRIIYGMDDIQWPYDNRARIWPKFPDICLNVEGKTPENKKNMCVLKTARPKCKLLWRS